MSETKTTAKPRPEDVASPDAIIKAMYEHHFRPGRNT